MIRSLVFTLLFGLMIVPANMAHAFCGFYVAKADASLFNEASKVVLSRAEDRTVITMSNDYKGDLEEFAIVIPVPTVITEKQVHVAENRIIEHLDAYTAPRLVEYFDSDPCQPMVMEMMMSAPTAMRADGAAMAKKSAKSLGVTVEAEYTVGEYDLVVLSAKQSDGLLTYLNQEGYKIPKGAEQTLGSYIKQNMKFFLAKVNLEEQAKSGYTYLRPLQVAYESPKFMLPIRLGTLNANGPQDLILYTLTQKGRVETANYRTTKIPSDINIPLYVKDEFGEFYKAMFDTAVKKEDMKTVFLEYAWDMGWCDPCAADPLANEDLRTLGVWWLNAPQDGIRPVPMPRRGIIAPPQGQNAFVTRLHVRYTAETFPEDLLLHETADRDNFQGRYVLNHPWTGEMSCPAGKDYLKGLPARFEEEAQNLAKITGWSIKDIRAKMETAGQSFDPDTIPKPKPWWEELWG